MIGQDLCFDFAFAQLVPLRTGLLRDVEDEQARQEAIPARYFAQSTTGLGVEGGTVGYSKAPQVQTFADDVIKQVEGIAIDLLIAGVITDKLATMIG